MAGVRLLLTLTFLLVMTKSLVVFACDVTLNTNSRGLNPGCVNPRVPYCVGGKCVQCNPYFGSDYVCDCADNRVCNEDFTSQTPGVCITPPKYGQSCSSSSDCVTNYNGGTSFSDLICLSGKCRQCDPAGSQAVPYNCTVGYIGQQRACISPGYWGVPSTSSGTTTTTTTGSGTTTSDAR